MATFLKHDGDKVLFSGDGELVYFVPDNYFKDDTTTDAKKAGIVIGEYVQVMGMFTYAVFDKNGKKVMQKQFNCPTIIKCKPNRIEKEPSMLLDGTEEEKAYRLLYFKDGDELISDVNIPQDLNNIATFINLFKQAKMPETIPYDEIQDYLIANAELNKFNYKVTWQVAGMLISALYRDKTDLKTPFRLAKTNDMLAYKQVNIKRAPKYVSAFTSITSEDTDEAIAAAITGNSKIKSPLEKVMMGAEV